MILMVAALLICVWSVAAFSGSVAIRVCGNEDQEVQPERLELHQKKRPMR